MRTMAASEAERTAHPTKNSVIAGLMQKALDRRSHFMGPLQGKGVAGLIDQADFDIGQQLQQG